MQTILFICVVAICGLVAVSAQISILPTGSFLLVLFGAYFCFALFRYQRMAGTLRKEFNRLHNDYWAAYGHRQSGVEFLQSISLSSLSSPPSFNESVDNFMNAVTDPVKFVTASMLVSVVKGIGDFFTNDKSGEQMQMEAMLYNAYSELRRSDRRFLNGVLVAATSTIGIVVGCNALSSPTHSNRSVATESTEVVAGSALSTTMASTPSPTLLLSPSVTSAPAVKLPAIQTKKFAVSEAPLEDFDSVEEAQRAAVERYPSLGIAGSKFNKAFLTRYKLYSQSNPEFFQSASWPFRLASEVSHEGQ